MGKYNSLGRNIFLVFLGNVTSKIVLLGMLPFYTEWLSRADYGTTDIITVYVTLLLSILTCCIADAIFVFPKGQSLDNQQKYFSSGLFFSFATLLLSLLILLLIRQYLFVNISNSFTKYFWFIWGLIVVTFLQLFLQQFLRSVNKITEYAISGIVLSLAIVISSFLLVPKYGLKGYLYAQIISLFASFLYAALSIKFFRYFHISKIDFSTCKEMLKYSVPLIPNGIMWWFVSAFNRPVIEANLGIDAVGLFAVSNKLPSVLIVLFSSFFLSWQISVVEEFKKEGYVIFYNKILRFFSLLLIFTSCFITIFSKDIISILVDEKFWDAWIYVPALAFAMFFSSISGFVGTNFLASRKSKYFFYSSFWGAAISILLNFLLIPHIGLWGAAIAVVVSCIAMSIFRIVYSWQYAPITHCSKYIIMILINLLLVITIPLISVMWQKMMLFIISSLLFGFINKDLFHDIKKWWNDTISYKYKSVF